MTEKPIKGAFLQQISSLDVELHARTEAGSFYIVTTGKNGDWTVYEIRWDPIDYMPVARKANWPEPGNHFSYFAVLEAEWIVGETLLLASRGSERRLKWEPHGTITHIVYGSVGAPGRPIPRCLDAIDPSRTPATQ